MRRKENSLPVNSYERYMATVQGEETDILPRIPILMHFAHKYYGTTYARLASDYETLVAANIKLVEDFGFDQLDVMCDPYRETTDFGGEIELREDAVPLCTKHPLAGTEDLSVLKKPNPYAPGRMNQTVKAVEAYREYGWKKYSITGWVEGPLAEAADLRGDAQILLDLMMEPEWAGELMDIVVDNAIEYARAQIEAGAETIGVGDAIVSQISADTYEELVLPRQKRLFDAIRGAGGIVRLHICGDTNHLLHLLAKAGPDMFDCDWMVDMKKAREAFGSRVVLTGNLDPVNVVMKGTPDQIREGFQNIYQQVGNPYIINAGCEVPAGTPDENLRALCEEVKWQE